MKKIVYLLAAFLCFCLLSCGGDDDGGDNNNGVIFGYVWDFSNNGEPVGDANVQLRPSGVSTKTGSNGRFEFSNVKYGTHNITVSKSGYSDLVDAYDIIVDSDKPVQRDAPIEREPVQLRLMAADGTANEITELNFGGAQDVRSFSILNINPYSLKWDIIVNAEWVVVSQLSGTLSANGGQQPITVSIDRSKQAEGIHSATISITSVAGTRDLTISTRVVSLSLNANPSAGGSVSPTTQSNIAAGAQVSISASAASGYSFVNWMVTNGQAQIADVNNAVTTAILTSDATISANFQNNTNPNPTGPSLAAQLLELHKNAQSGGEYTVELTGNENIGAQPLTFSDRSDITIRVIGIGGERIITLTDNGSIFTVGTGVTLILDERVTLRGKSGNNAPVVRVDARGKLIMKAGSKISGNNNSGSGGGVVVGTDGDFILDGGEISGNNASGWSSGGGGVHVANGGYFSMENGRISANSSSSGGGVYVANANFLMKGGEIVNNSANAGGGVEIGEGNFTMEGGRISSNTANTTSSSSGGGGIYVGRGNFVMNDGEISGNTARSGGGVFVENAATFTKSGGTIYGYVLGDSKRNTATAGIASNDRGHAVFVNSNPSKRRESTASEQLNLDSEIAGALGGWE